MAASLESKVVWRDGMAFDAHADGHTFTIDAHETFGGQGLGPKPKSLTLTSLAGCTGMDVISILKKMRVEVRHFQVSKATNYPSKSSNAPYSSQRRAIAASAQR